MSTQEFDEFGNYELVSRQRRYFSDVCNLSDSYVNMQIAIETLAESTNIGITQEETAVLFKETLAGLGYDPSLPEGELRDIFTIAPFLAIGPVIDKSKGIIEAREWYNDSLSYLRVGMNPAHTNECVDSPSFAYNNTCEHGNHCPLITVAKFLEQDLFDTDFSAEKYDNDALIRYQISIEKEKLAIEFKLRNKVNAEALIDMYQRNNAMFFMGPQ